MRIDQRLESEQSQARTDVLLDEFSFFIDFISCKRELCERCRACARSADESSASIVLPNRLAHRRTAQSRHQLDLISAAEENSAGLFDQLHDAWVARLFAGLHNRNLHLFESGGVKITPPPSCARPDISRGCCQSDDRTFAIRRCETSERTERITVWTGSTTEEDERSRARARVPIGTGSRRGRIRVHVRSVRIQLLVSYCLLSSLAAPATAVAPRCG